MDGTIYVGSWDLNLYAIESSSGGLADSPWPMFHHNLKHTGRALPVIDGCINLKTLPLTNSQVILKQSGEPRQVTTTDDNGCYEFASVVSGKRFLLLIKGPIVP